MLRGEPPTRLITMKQLQTRGMTEVRVTAELRLVPVLDHHLSGLGVTADVTSSRTYERSQAFSLAVWAHSDRPDGFQYRCRHDNSLTAVALFDRGGVGLRSVATEPLDRDLERLLRWKSRWGFAIAP